MKKFLSAVCALVLVFGSAAVLPEGFAKLDSAITASAETFGDFNYKVLDDGTVEISKYRGREASVTIPSVIDEKTVKTIGNGAFSPADYNNRNETLKSVTIPDTVTVIGNSAFQNCAVLTDVKIPDTVTSIGNYAFSSSGLEQIDLPDSLETIGAGAFYHCARLKSITIPDNVTSIGNFAFEECLEFTSITIPASVSSVGRDVFTKCSKLESITVSADNSNYSSEDGLLLSKDKTQLVFCPEAKTTLTIPNSVTSINDNSIGYCHFTSVEIPENVVSIGSWTFFVCDELEKAVIPESVESIGTQTFASCPNLTIYCVTDSAAHKYAQERDISFVLLDGKKKGDLNDNGKIDASDLLQVKSHIKKVKPLEGDDFTCADVDGNGAINAADLLKMKAHMKGVTLLWE